MKIMWRPWCFDGLRKREKNQKEFEKKMKSLNVWE